MIDSHNMKSYIQKWAEAERELAIRRIILPTHPINPEHSIIQKDEIYPPLIPDKPNSGNPSLNLPM